MPVHFPYLLDPTIYADYRRRPNRVPTWKTFDNATQLATLRFFAHKDNRLADVAATIDKYVDKNQLGRAVWSCDQPFFAENFPELVAEIKRRKLYLFDVGTMGWARLILHRKLVGNLKRALGDRFLGLDNGEQDGRYIGCYSPQQCPVAADRFRQYLNFQQYFEQFGDDHGNCFTALITLFNGHYFLREGNHILVGAETGQSLPNSQLYYAFIRGACKQYGVLWFGCASVWNRWGWKRYDETGGTEGADAHGPTKGTSANLLKRLLYSHYLYNCAVIGLEQSWFMKDQSLSPLGHMQAAIGRFIAQHGQPGPMHTPVALLLDAHAGWCLPRHYYMDYLYNYRRDAVYQVWGALPYEAGDYLTHSILSLLYSGYDDASYFRDERGFLSATPHGDMSDCLLSDAPGWVLNQYGLVVAAGRLQADVELRDKLEKFVTGGGHLVVTAGNARALWPEWQIGPAEPVNVGARIHWTDGREITESVAFALCPVAGIPGMKILATCGDKPAVAEITLGAGRITLLLSPFGLNECPDFSIPIKNEEEKSLACPFKLLEHARQTLADAFAAQQIFSVGEDLAFITCRKRAGEYTLGIHNNGLSARPFKIISHAGEIERIDELSLDQSEKGTLGYWPEGFENNDGGKSDAATIAGGDIRLFAVRIREQNLRVLPLVKPPRRTWPRLLALRGIADLKTELLRYATFFQHFDGVKLDWTYLYHRDRQQLKREANWLKRQKVQLMVDFSSGLNSYPDLSLVDYSGDCSFLPPGSATPRVASVAAFDDVFAKMKALDAADAIIAVHTPESGEADERFQNAVRDLCRRAAQRGITLHLQSHPHRHHRTSKAALDFIGQVTAALEPGQAGSLRFALNTSHAVIQGESLTQVIKDAGERLGLVLISAPARDAFGTFYDLHRPAHAGDLDLTPLAETKCPVVLDADYASWNEIYPDLKLLERFIPDNLSSGGSG